MLETEFTPILPVFVFILVAILTAVGMLTASAVLGPKKLTPVKQMPYESGMDPIGDARQRFDVRYYLVAIVFLLFDVELLFLYPWAVAQWSRDLPASAKVAAAATATAMNTTRSATATTTTTTTKTKTTEDTATTTTRTTTSVPAAATAPAVPPLVAGVPPVYRNLVFGEILVFLAILAAAFAYAWRKGVFEWR